MRGAVHVAVHGAVGDAVGDAVDVAVDDAVRGAVDDAVHGAVRDAVHGAVRGAVDDAVDDAVHGAVDDAVHGAVRGAVDDAVHGAVGDAVHGAVGDAVGDAVDVAVDVAVRGAVDDAVHGAVQLQKLPWHYWLGGQFWVGGWWGSPAYVSFFTDVCGLELSKDITERANAYRDICESVNYIWPNRNFVMVCERPAAIRRNEQGQLSNDQKKAIEYPDGWGLYALDGVVLDESLWSRIVSKQMSFKEIMQIENADHRAVALKYNPEAILASGANLIDKSERGNELFLIEKTELNTFLEEPSIYFLRMKCPTGRVFIEGVDPQYARANPYADHCQAVALGLTPTQYGFLRQEG